MSQVAAAPAAGWSSLSTFNPNPRSNGQALPKPIEGAEFVALEKQFFSGISDNALIRILEPRISGQLVFSGLNTEQIKKLNTAVMLGNKSVGDEHYQGLSLYRMGFVRDVWLRGMGTYAIGMVWYRFTKDTCSSGVFMMLKARMMSLVPWNEKDNRESYEARLNEKLGVARNTFDPNKPLPCQLGTAADPFEFRLQVAHGGRSGPWKITDAKADAPIVFGLEILGKDDLEALRTQAREQTETLCANFDRVGLVNLSNQLLRRSGGGARIFLPMTQ